MTPAAAAMACAVIFKKYRMRAGLSCAAVSSLLCHLANTLKAQQVRTKEEVENEYVRKNGGLPPIPTVQTVPFEDPSPTEIEPAGTIVQTSNVIVLPGAGAASNVYTERVEILTAKSEPTGVEADTVINPDGIAGEFKIGFSVQIPPTMSQGEYTIHRTVFDARMVPRATQAHVFRVRGKEAGARTHRTFPVWFATNRAQADSDAGRVDFSSVRGGRLTYGIALVNVPKHHRFGVTEPKWWYKLLSVDVDDFDIVRVTKLSDDAFAASMRTALTGNSEDERDILLFIHGYNTTFGESVRRAAQVGYDLKVAGLTALFSWPSVGTADGYPADEASVEASERELSVFIEQLSLRTGARRINLIAHSMGNRALLRALQRMRSGQTLANGVKFGQILLAAPDVDADVFGDLGEFLPRLSERTTLYISPIDLALRTSKWFHRGARAGYAPPVTVVKGIDTVRLDSSESLLGHSYFAEEPLLYDMYNLLRFNSPPERRQRLMREDDGKGKTYWFLR